MLQPPAQNEVAFDVGLPDVTDDKQVDYYKAQMEIKRLKDETKKLKKQLLGSEQNASNLQKLLKDAENEKQLYYISLKDARKITYKALRKGSAAQHLINVIQNNSINYKLKKKAINQLMLNAFGVIHNIKKTAIPDMLKYTDSHLKLFRQEQLILLAENERLAEQIKDLQKQVLDNKIENLKKNEAKYMVPMRTMDTVQKMKYNESQIDENFIELDADMVENKLNALIKNIKMARFRLISYAFRKLTNNVCRNIDMRDVDDKINKMRTSNGILKLSHIMEKKGLRAIENSFYKLLYGNKKSSTKVHSSNMRHLTNTDNYIHDPTGSVSVERGHNNGDFMISDKHDNSRSVRQHPRSHLNDMSRNEIYKLEDYYRNKGYANFTSGVDKSRNKNTPYYIHKPYYYNNLPSANIEFPKRSIQHYKNNSENASSYLHDDTRNYYGDTPTYEPGKFFDNLQKDMRHMMHLFNDPTYGDYDTTSNRMNVDMYENLENPGHQRTKIGNSNDKSKHSHFEKTHNTGLDRYDSANGFINPFEEERLYKELFPTESEKK